MNAFDYFFENTQLLEKPFLVGREEISFRELYNSSLKLASWLRQELGENNNILLLSVNNKFFLTAYLAIIKSGNICIPLDPGIESDNFNFIADLTKPVMIFVTKDIEKRLNFHQYECVYPETISYKKNKKIKEFESHKHFNIDECAEIIFTSGSTGEPKGVMLSHKNLIANTESIIEYLDLGKDDRMLVVLPFYYCYGLSLLHTHLRVGGSIVFNNSFIFLGAVLNNLIDYKCTGFAGVPTHFQILLRKSDSFKSTHFPDLKYVTQAGGKLASVFIDEFRESQPDIKFWVMYGQTEATARLSFLQPELYEHKRGSIGINIPGVELKIVNENGEQVDTGEPGEVIARGDNIMIGYFSDKESTRNTIKDGWLYTGDLGTIDNDGFIYLTARKKEIIKVRGKRISPKEIEAVILEIPEVVDCVIEGIADELYGEAIKATVIIENEKKKEEALDSIKQHCYNNLALYKMPHIFELKNRLVISPTGKKIRGKF